jgi:hypothetical protein
MFAFRATVELERIDIGLGPVFVSAAEAVKAPPSYVIGPATVAAAATVRAAVFPVRPTVSPERSVTPTPELGKFVELSTNEDPESGQIVRVPVVLKLRGQLP